MGECVGKLKSLLPECLNRNQFSEDTKKAIKSSRSIIRPKILPFTKKVATGTAIVVGAGCLVGVVGGIGLGVLLIVNPAGTAAVVSGAFSGAGAGLATASSTVLTTVSIAAIPATVVLSVGVVGVGALGVTYFGFKVVRPHIRRGNYLAKREVKIEKHLTNANEKLEKIKENLKQFKRKDDIDAVNRRESNKVAKLCSGLQIKKAKIILEIRKLEEQGEKVKTAFDNWKGKHNIALDVTAEQYLISKKKNKKLNSDEGEPVDEEKKKDKDHHLEHPDEEPHTEDGSSDSEGNTF